MTIYRLIHGKIFYEANLVPIDISASIVRGEFASRLPWLAHVPSAWRRFIRKAMNDNTRQRFQTALQMSQAAGQLPVVPQWKCDYSRVKTVWKCAAVERCFCVVHEVQSSRKHTWEATSTKDSKSRHAGGSGGAVSGSAARKGLEDFFEKRQSVSLRSG